MSIDRGQASLELALALPLVITLLLAFLQVAVVVRGQLAVQTAARNGARAASAAANASAAASAAAQRATDLRPIRVSTTSSARTVTVVVTYQEPTNLPIVGALLPDVTLTGRATMELEPP
jgi:uncharacterized protein (UPF0333 family)